MITLIKENNESLIIIETLKNLCTMEKTHNLTF